jgi:hypothetical protein
MESEGKAADMSAASAPQAATAGQWPGKINAGDVLVMVRHGACREFDPPIGSVGVALETGSVVWCNFPAKTSDPSPGGYEYAPCFGVPAKQLTCLVDDQVRKLVPGELIEVHHPDWPATFPRQAQIHGVTKVDDVLVAKLTVQQEINGVRFSGFGVIALECVKVLAADLLGRPQDAYVWEPSPEEATYKLEPLAFTNDPRQLAIDEARKLADTLSPTEKRLARQVRKQRRLGALTREQLLAENQRLRDTIVQLNASAHRRRERARYDAERVLIAKDMIEAAVGTRPLSLIGGVSSIIDAAITMSDQLNRLSPEQH